MKYLFIFLVTHKQKILLVVLFFLINYAFGQDCPSNITFPADHFHATCGGDIEAGDLTAGQNAAIGQIEVFNTFPPNTNYLWYNNSNFTNEITNINDLPAPTFPSIGACEPDSITIYLAVDCQGNILSGGQVTFVVYPPYEASLFETVDGNCGVMPSIIVDCPYYTLNVEAVDGVYYGNWEEEVDTAETGELIWSIDLDLEAGDSGEVLWSIEQPGSPFNCTFPNDFFTTEYECLECPTVSQLYDETLTFCSGSEIDKQFPVDIGIFKNEAYILDSDNTGSIEWYDNIDFTGSPITAADLSPIPLTTTNVCNPQITYTAYAALTCSSDPSADPVYAGTIQFEVYPNIDIDVIWTVNAEDECKVPFLVINNECDENIYDITTTSIPSGFNGGETIEAGEDASITWTVTYDSSIVFDSNPNDMGGCVLTDTYSTNTSCTALSCPTVTEPLLTTIDICDDSAFNSTLLLNDVDYNDPDNTFGGYEWFLDKDLTIPQIANLSHDVDPCEIDLQTIYLGLLCTESNEYIDAGTLDVNIYPDISLASIGEVIVNDCTIPDLVINNDCDETIYDINPTITLNGSVNTSVTPGDPLASGDEVSVSWVVEYKNSAVANCTTANFDAENTCAYTSCASVDTPLNASTQVCDGDAPNFASFEEDIIYSEGAFSGFQWYTDQDLTTPITGSGALYHEGGACEAYTTTLYVGLLCEISNTPPEAAGSLTVTIYPEINTSETMWVMSNAETEDCFVPSLTVECDNASNAGNYSITYSNSIGNLNPGDVILPGTNASIIFNIDYAGDLANSVCSDTPKQIFVSYTCPEQICPSVIPIEEGTTVSLCNGNLPNLSQLESQVGVIGGTSEVTFQWYLDANQTTPLPNDNSYTVYTGNKCEVQIQDIYLVAYCAEEPNIPLEAGSVSLQIYPELVIDINSSNSIWSLVDEDDCVVPTLSVNCGNSNFYKITSKSNNKNFGEGDELQGGESGTITWTVSFADGIIPCSNGITTYKYSYACDCFKDGNTVTYSNEVSLPFYTQTETWIKTQGNISVENNKKILFQSGGSVEIGPGFKTQNNSAFKIKLGGCEDASEIIKYATLKKQLDESFYRTRVGRLYVKYEEEYFKESGSNLLYTIYDEERNVKSSNSATIPIEYGTNWIEINMWDEIGTDTNNLDRYYILEVSNDKGEIGYVRFLYKLK